MNKEELSKAVADFNDKLLSMSKRERIKYIREQLDKIDVAIDNVIANPSLKTSFLRDFADNSYIFLGCLLNSIEEELRPDFVKIIVKLMAMLGV